MSLDEELHVHYEHAAYIDQKMVKTAFDDFISRYKIELLGSKSVCVSVEPASGKLLMKISSQSGSEIGAVLLREDFVKQRGEHPEIAFSGAMGKRIFFYSEQWMYAVEIKKR